MSSTNPKIFCIYPNDKTTTFLNRVVTYLKKNLGADFYCYKIRANDASHEICIEKLKKHKNSFILFLGHGRSDALFGAYGDLGGNIFVSKEAVEDNPKFYSNDTFITRENISVFSTNIVFSFSCNSNDNGKESLGHLALNSGTKTLIGFGDVPTDYDHTLPFTKTEISIFKGIISRIIKCSILYSVEKNYTPEKLVNVIKMFTNKEIYKLIKNQRGIKYRHRIAECLYFFKNDIEIFGERNQVIGNNLNT